MADIQPIDTPTGFEFPFSTGYQSTDDPVSSFGLAISNIIGFLTIVAAVAFIFYFLIGAINWVTSSGDDQKIQKARTTVTQAILGLAITAIAYPAVYLITKLLGIPLADPTELFSQLSLPGP